MNPLWDARLAIVDVETTGTHGARDRVTEVAVLEIDRGTLTAEWSALVDPRIPIPPAIQALTGITDTLVAGAPAFHELAAALHERLAGRLFVAHNAAFDYGFLRREFARAGLRFHARTLCTVRLSRRLYPEHAHHDLDSVIARHRLAGEARHRALGDARAVWAFLQAAAAEHGLERLATAARQVGQRPALPPRLAPERIEAIPEAPGVYLLYGEEGTLLYVGHGARLRSRVLRHFAASPRSLHALRLARAVHGIDWERTAGELGARLRQAELLRRLAPAFNRRPRVARRGRNAAAPVWPYRGAIGIVERDAGRDATEVHVVRQWSWLGCARSEDEIAELLQVRHAPPLDFDRVRILARHLASGRARVVAL